MATQTLIESNRCFQVVRRQSVNTRNVMLQSFGMVSAKTNFTQSLESCEFEFGNRYTFHSNIMHKQAQCKGDIVVEAAGFCGFITNSFCVCACNQHSVEQRWRISVNLNNTGQYVMRDCTCRYAAARHAKSTFIEIYSNWTILYTMNSSTILRRASQILFIQVFVFCFHSREEIQNKKTLIEYWIRL